MESTIPTEFDQEFLDWFRQCTERTWATYPIPTLERGSVGCVWQQDTRWIGGLEEPQVSKIEHVWSLIFPPDYRLFLQRLHAVDRPMRCTAWREVNPGGPEQLELREQPAFYNWLTDTLAIQSRMDDLVTGLLFDVEHNDLWRPGWGVRLAPAEAREQRVRQLVAGAPRLIPVFGHRYLLGEPCEAGRPVLSVMQADIVIYGAHLRDYFLVEFADLLGIDSVQVRKEVGAVIQDCFRTYAAIPFWGDLLAR